MPQFLIAYHNPRKPESEAEGKRLEQAYQKGIANLGEAAITPMAPLGQSKYIEEGEVKEGRVQGAMMGYTLIQAEDFDAAFALAQSCPFTQMGTLQVSQVIAM